MRSASRIHDRRTTLAGAGRVAEEATEALHQIRLVLSRSPRSELESVTKVPRQSPPREGNQLSQPSVTFLISDALVLMGNERDRVEGLPLATCCRVTRSRRSIPSRRPTSSTAGHCPCFTRSLYESMYRGRLWTMRQFAGFGGTAQGGNVLEHGEDRAFDGV